MEEKKNNQSENNDKIKAKTIQQIEETIEKSMNDGFFNA